MAVFAHGFGAGMMERRAVRTGPGQLMSFDVPRTICWPTATGGGRSWRSVKFVATPKHLRGREGPGRRGSSMITPVGVLANAIAGRDGAGPDLVAAIHPPPKPGSGSGSTTVNPMARQIAETRVSKEALKACPVRATRRGPGVTIDRRWPRLGALLEPESLRQRFRMESVTLEGDNRYRGPASASGMARYSGHVPAVAAAHFGPEGATTHAPRRPRREPAGFGEGEGLRSIKLATEGKTRLVYTYAATVGREARPGRRQTGMLDGVVEVRSGRSLTVSARTWRGRAARAWAAHCAQMRWGAAWRILVGRTMKPASFRLYGRPPQQRERAKPWRKYARERPASIAGWSNRSRQMLKTCGLSPRALLIGHKKPHRRVVARSSKTRRRSLVGASGGRPERDGGCDDPQPSAAAAGQALRMWPLPDTASRGDRVWGFGGSRRFRAPRFRCVLGRARGRSVELQSSRGQKRRLASEGDYFPVGDRYQAGDRRGPLRLRGGAKANQRTARDFRLCRVSGTWRRLLPSLPAACTDKWDRRRLHLEKGLRQARAGCGERTAGLSRSPGSSTVAGGDGDRIG